MDELEFDGMDIPETTESGFEEYDLSVLSEEDFDLRDDGYQDYEPVQAAEDENFTDTPESADDAANSKGQIFTLKHLGETKEVDANEVITLAQMGLDYPRIREKLNKTNSELGAVSESHSLISELAAASGVDPHEFIARTRGEIISKRDGIPLSEATSRVRELIRFENRTSEKRAREIREFMASYPEVAPESIPDEVWESMRRDNSSLLTSYSAYENKRLRTELNAERQNRKNQSGAAGSLKSSGKTSELSEFDKFWYDD